MQKWGNGEGVFPGALEDSPLLEGNLAFWLGCLCHLREQGGVCRATLL